MSSKIYLSIILPLRNEEECIRATLESLIGQDYPQVKYELIVVDGRSTDKTRDVVRQVIAENPDVTISLLDNPGQLSSRARNIGARAAQGELIAVIDGHVFISNVRLFAAMERLKEMHDSVCLARPAPLRMPSYDCGMPLWIALARKSWLAHSRNSYIYSDFEGFIDPVSSGFAYDRTVFDRVGYFDESFDAAEDIEFHHRLRQADIRAYTSPDLTIYSFPRATLRDLFRQMGRYGIGRAHLIKKHKDAFTKETLIPPAIFLYFVSLPLALLLAFWLPFWSGGYVLGAMFYGTLLIATGIACRPHSKGLLPSLLVALAIWTTHMGLGWGFIKTVLRPRRMPSGVSIHLDTSQSCIEESRPSEHA